MEAKQQIITIKCRNCSSDIRWAAPKAQGFFQLTCPHCGSNNAVRFVPKEIRLQEAAAKTASEAERHTQQQGSLFVECPDCQSKLRFAPPKDGFSTLSCPKCNINMRVCVKGNKILSVQKIQTKILDSECNRSNGRLMQLRFGGIIGGLGSKSFLLHQGQNTVGRYDDELHSDIEIKGDPCMSRRSICIEVLQKEIGFLFKMKVLKATWPVMHNDKPLVEGEVVYLNYGDRIKLGKTLFIFNKASSK